MRKVKAKLFRKKAGITTEDLRNPSYKMHLSKTKVVANPIDKDKPFTIKRYTAVNTKKVEYKMLKKEYKNELGK